MDMMTYSNQSTFLKQIISSFSSWKRPLKDNVAQCHTVPRLQYDITAHLRTDAGCHRDKNEDCIRYVQPGGPALLERKGVLAIVADGMGGHAAGEVASHMAVEVISQMY